MADHDDKETKKQLEAQARWAALDDADIDETIRVLLQLAKGQKFLWWLLQVGKVGMQPFTGDRNTTDFQCGELNVGQQILARYIDVNPLGYAEMQMERKREDERRDDLSRPRDGDPRSDDPDGSADS